ncbi:MAG: hypothetical protein IT428_08875 [Planctomycetaceae bacterium]|nr:hypothetical protein [Planctomycetaceae bacterium]
MPTTLPASLLRSAEDLTMSIQTATNRQVHGLQVNLTGDDVTVTGHSRTFYVKQLVTQAIKSHLPAARLQNRICVQTH